MEDACVGCSVKREREEEGERERRGGEKKRERCVDESSYCITSHNSKVQDVTTL